MSTTPLRTDVAIVGAGPAGLFAVFQCGMLNMRCHVIDALAAAGGQCRALYPEKPIFDIPGYPEIPAGTLIDKLEQQAAPFEPVCHYGQQAAKLEPAADGRWCVETSAGTRIDAAAVIVAAGVGAFGPNRPPLEGLENYENQGAGEGVHYLVGRREDFRSKRVVIAGGGDSAVDWAVSLAGLAESIAVVHRRPKFRAAPDSVEKMKRLTDEGAIDMVVPYQLAGLEGTGGRLEAVVVADLDGNPRHLPADALLSFFGLAQDLGPIAQWGFSLADNRIAVDPATCGTGRPGIFAIGDIAVYPGKLKLILTGFSEAAMAAHAAYPLVHPDEALHFEYSTTKGVPGGNQ